MTRPARIAERRDDKGSVTLAGFDTAHRAVRLWAGDRPGQALTLRQAMVYGDDTADSGLTGAQALAANAMGRIVTSYDEAGAITTGGYDLDGNPLNTTRQILQPGLLIMQAPAAGQWTDERLRRQLAARRRGNPRQTTPATAPGRHRVPHRHYLRRTRPPHAPALHRSTTPAAAPSSPSSTAAAADSPPSPSTACPYLQQVAYDAHGRRSLVQLGNGVLLRYLYDPAPCGYGAATPARHADGHRDPAGRHHDGNRLADQRDCGAGPHLPLRPGRATCSPSATARQAAACRPA